MFRERINILHQFIFNSRLNAICTKEIPFTDNFQVIFLTSKTN
jgi:hypothetical protein